MDYLKELLQRSDIGASRSSVLNPLQWTLVITGFCLIVSVAIKAPNWVSIVAGFAFGGTFISILGVYGYFMFKDPDALRSEQYTLSKMALERGLVGDSLTGLIEQKGAAGLDNSPKLLQGEAKKD